MQSNNPILNRVEVYADYSQPMTIQGAIQKSVLLTVIAAVVGLGIFFYSFISLNISIAYSAAIVGAIGGFILALITTFKPNTAKTLAIPYALFEGAFLGGVSVIFQLKFPGVPLQALLATFVTTLVMFTLYRLQIVRATEKFKSVVLSATIAIAIVFVVQLVMRLAFGSSVPYIFESNWLGIGFAAFVAVIASLNLILDFDLRQVIETKLSLRTIRNLLSFISRNALKPYSYAEVKRELKLSEVTQKKILHALESIYLIRRFKIDDAKGDLFLLEDQIEEYILSGGKLDRATQLLTALYRNIRAQYVYRSGELFEFFQYRTRGGALVPLAIKTDFGSLGFIIIEKSEPNLSEKRSDESFIRKYPQGKILYLSEKTKEAVAISSNQLIVPLFALI